MKCYKVLFGIFVLMVLVIPLFHMNTTDITELENRTLAKLPRIKKKGKLNTNYGKEFEKWLGDRFWGRDKLIETRFQVLYKINGRIENDKAFIGDDGWMFDKKIEKTQNSQKSDAKNRIKKLKRLSKILNKKGIDVQVYYVKHTDRNLVYQKFFKGYFKEPYTKQIDFVQEFSNSCKKCSNIHIIDPQKDLLEKSNTTQVFYKTDFHMSMNGKKVVYQKLLDSLFPANKLLWELVPSKIKSYYFAQALGMRSNEDTVVVTSVKFKGNYNFQYTRKGSLTNRTWPEFEMTKFPNSTMKNNLYVLGQCGAYGLNQLFSPFFKNTYYFHITKKSFKNSMDKYFINSTQKGDIVILYNNRALIDFLSYLESKN